MILDPKHVPPKIVLKTHQLDYLVERCTYLALNEGKTRGVSHYGLTIYILKAS